MAFSLEKQGRFLHQTRWKTFAQRQLFGCYDMWWHTSQCSGSFLCMGWRSEFHFFSFSHLPIFSNFVQFSILSIFPISQFSTKNSSILSDWLIKNLVSLGFSSHIKKWKEFGQISPMCGRWYQEANSWIVYYSLPNPGSHQRQNSTAFSTTGGKKVTFHIPCQISHFHRNSNWIF